VVGLGLLPQTAHSSFDQGVWMSSEGLHAVAPTLATPQDYTIVVRFASRRSLETGIDRLQQRLGGDADIEGFSPPQDVTLLRNVRGLPKALAAFLVFLGLCAMAHALLSAVRRRRHDLAVLRAVGFRPLQVAACVLWQALTVSVVVLALGIPLGSSPGDGRGGGWPTPRRCTTSLPSP
jgi:ABC-type antimicrobial peptide transport system permease subunit